MDAAIRTLTDLVGDQRVWMVNVNRKIYDIFEHAHAGATDTWRFDKRRDEARIGDIVLFRVGEPAAGLYIVGRLDGGPVEVLDPDTGKPDWQAPLHFTYSVDPPALREELLGDPELVRFGPFRGLQGNNFLVPDETVRRLSEVLRDRLRPLERVDLTLRSARQALRDHQDHIRDGLLRRVRSLPPPEFEQLIGRLLAALGYEDIRVVGRSGDRGIDIRATQPARLGPALAAVIQVKRFAERNRVAGDIVRSLRGARDPGQRAFLVTTSSFTADAVAEATSQTGRPGDRGCRRPNGL